LNHQKIRGPVFQVQQNGAVEKAAVLKTGPRFSSAAKVQNGAA
jgi:hypothetical protein